MVGKAKAALKNSPAGDAKDLAQGVLDSSHQVWLAGVGAFARAQKEGMKMFESLVHQGERLERKTRQVAADTAAAARSAATARAKEMHDMAGGTWDKLEQVFEDRVARALGKLGVYTQNDVRKLADRVDALSAAVNELLKATGAAPAAKAARSAAKPRRKAAKAAPKAAPRRRAKRKPAA
jgi:poly(hydroxyalkanoate) granule-associated protein